MRGSRGGAAAADFEDQALIVNGNSRWCNYYVEGVRWVTLYLPYISLISPLYLPYISRWRN